MKKILVLTASLLLSLLAHSQEAEDNAQKPLEVTVVTRAEYSNTEDDNLGNSSAYILLDGRITPNFTYSVSTHLLSSDPKLLYDLTLRSDCCNWLDWAFLGYDFGKFDVELGKLCLDPGTFELQEYDFDIYYDLASAYWSSLNVYQWGARLRWRPVDEFRVSASFTTSPNGEKPFVSKLYSYTVHASGEAGPYEGLFSFNFHQRPDMTYMKLFNMGHRFNIGNWQLTWDSTMDLSLKGVPMSQLLYATYSPNEKWAFTAEAAYETSFDLLELSPGHWFGGLLINWKPVDMLRFHGDIVYDPLFKAPRFNLGVTWQITL
ncbi:MAG: hypothetical protein MJY42_03060 [Bacteroidales bacterium]|nr:hypothetical protein [Bacteroidales bacterium]